MIITAMVIFYILVKFYYAYVCIRKTKMCSMNFPFLPSFNYLFLSANFVIVRNAIVESVFVTWYTFLSIVAHFFSLNSNVKVESVSVRCLTF